MTKIYDVFTPNNFPNHTYILREPDYESDINFCIESNIIAFVHGPTKSGKSVLVQHAIRNLSVPTVRLSARNFKSSDEFWESVALEVGYYDSEVQQLGRSKGSQSSVSLISGLKTWFAEVNLGGEITAQIEKTASKQRTFPINTRGILKNGKQAVLVIDNFHYITDKSVQKSILQEIRDILDYIAIIIIAITDMTDYLISIEKELLNRCLAISLREWSSEELFRIAEKGFKELNVDLSPKLKSELAQESVGAPAIMQALCLGLALQNKIYEKRESQSTIDHISSAVYRRTSRLLDMTSTYDKLFEIAFGLGNTKELVTLREQPRRNLTQDTRVSIYEAILQTLVSDVGTIKARSVIEDGYKKVVIFRNTFLPDFDEMAVSADVVDNS